MDLQTNADANFDLGKKKPNIHHVMEDGIFFSDFQLYWNENRIIIIL